MYVRKCQECGHKQEAKDPATYKDAKSEAWRNIKCRQCKSEALDYGSEDTGNWVDWDYEPDRS